MPCLSDKNITDSFVSSAFYSIFSTILSNNPIGSGGVSAATYISSWGSTAVTGSYNTVITKLDQYITTQGYYVPQSGDTWATIANQNYNAVSITWQELQKLNNVLPGSNFTVGQLIYVPMAAVTVTTTPTDLSTLTALNNPDAVYVYDATTNSIYAMGGQTTNNGGTDISK